MGEKELYSASSANCNSGTGDNIHINMFLRNYQMDISFFLGIVLNSGKQKNIVFLSSPLDHGMDNSLTIQKCIKCLLSTSE